MNLIAENGSKAVPQCGNDMPSGGVGHDDPELMMLFEGKMMIDPLENGASGLGRRSPAAKRFNDREGPTGPHDQFSLAGTDGHSNPGFDIEAVADDG